MQHDQPKAPESSAKRASLVPFVSSAAALALRVRLVNRQSLNDVSWCFAPAQLHSARTAKADEMRLGVT